VSSATAIIPGKRVTDFVKYKKYPRIFKFGGEIKRYLNQSVPQDTVLASYFPLRSPDDGLIIWDTMAADQILKMIHALNDPFPNAFTFYKNKKFILPRLNCRGFPFTVCLARYTAIAILACWRAPRIDASNCSPAAMMMAPVV